MKFVCDNVTIIEVRNVASSQLIEFVVVKCWLVVQQRCKYVILYLTLTPVNVVGKKEYL